MISNIDVSSLSNSTLTITFYLEDGVGNQGPAENDTVEKVAELTSYDISLSAGWNLISLPLVPDDTDITVITAGISSNLNIVKYYDASSTSWITYAPGAGGSLVEMEDGKGYWLYMSNNDTLTINGSEINPNKTYDIVAGAWNLIGFTSANKKLCSDYNTAAEFANDEVREGAGDGGYGPIIHDSTTDEYMNPGSGYWLYHSGSDYSYTVTP
jgi:hypothetical protein